MTYNQPQSGGPYEQRPGGYGQQPPAYGQPGYGAPAPGQRPYSFQQSESFGIVGTVLTLLAGVALIVAFTAIDWAKASNTTFGNLGDAIDNQPGATAFSQAYFGWLAWVFLIVVVVAGVLASVPSPALRVFRIIGIVVGLAAAGLTFLAINVEGSYTDALKSMRAGFYLTVVAFVVAGVGAGIGPRRV